MPYTNACPSAKIYPKNSSRWNLGMYSRLILLNHGYLPVCKKCNSNERIEVNHKNFKWWDLRIKNLEWLCIYCHKKIHQPLMAKKLSATRKRLFREGKLSVWNKGLNKFDNETLALAGKKTSKTRLEKFASGELKSWNKGLSKESDERIRKCGRKHSKTLKRIFKEGFKSDKNILKIRR